MTEFAIQAVNVTKRFGGNVAVNNISLSIEPGEFFSFLGPSGCGKTTLLRMMAGFETPTTGEILINGKNVVAVPPHKRPVNMVFQSYALFPHLSVFDNIAFGLKAKAGANKAEIAERVRASLDLVRLGHLSERFPAQLSGGQQQRVALARAVVNRPSVLLLDEPLSALDPQIREEMQFELGRLQRSLDMTFVMVTHDQAEALALSSRVAVFCLGNLEQVGKPEEIYDNPKTLFVAKFIGQTNLLSGKLLERAEGKARVEIAENFVLTVKDNACLTDANNPGGAGARVAVWIKPQAVRVTAADLAESGETPTNNSNNSFLSEVVGRSYQGVDTEYLLEFGGGMNIRACLPNRTAHGDFQMYEVGDRLEVTIPWQAASFLKESGSARPAEAEEAGLADETQLEKIEEAALRAP